MSKLAEYIETVDLLDERFMGTIAFHDEEICLPDGSKIALGIDDGHWVLIYQRMAGAHIKVYEFDQKHNKIIVDQKPGGDKEKEEFKKCLGYFFDHAETNDLVTILPPRG